MLRYNKKDNETKKKYSEHMLDKILSHPNCSRAYWTLSNKNFNDSHFTPLHIRRWLSNYLVKRESGTLLKDSNLSPKAN